MAKLRSGERNGDGGRAGRAADVVLSDGSLADLKFDKDREDGVADESNRGLNYVGEEGVECEVVGRVTFGAVRMDLVEPTCVNT